MAGSHRGNGVIGRWVEQCLLEKYHSYYQVQGYGKSNLGKEVGIQEVGSTHQLLLQNIECIKDMTYMGMIEIVLSRYTPSSFSLTILST
jgi:hypothetical protein